MYFNAIVVYLTFRIIIDGRICIQFKLKPDIFLDILQINKYNRGGDNCDGNIAVDNDRNKKLTIGQSQKLRVTRFVRINFI